MYLRYRKKLSQLGALRQDTQSPEVGTLADLALGKGYVLPALVPPSSQCSCKRVGCGSQGTDLTSEPTSVSRIMLSFPSALVYTQLTLKLRL